MKGKIFALSGIVGLIGLLSACAPQLARTNYGPEEQQWKGYIQNSYQGWAPPPAPAPYSNTAITTTSVVPNSDAASLGDVPQAADQPEVTATTTEPKDFSSGTTLTDNNSAQMVTTTPSSSNTLSGVTTASNIPQPEVSPSNSSTAPAAEFNSQGITNTSVAPVPSTYTVQKGDSLWTISKKIYKDDGASWKKLYNANRDKLSSPNALKAGMVLKIPQA